MGEMVKFKILPLDIPFEGYLFNVQLWKSIDGGKTFCYAGFGKYCRNVEEVDSYIRMTLENLRK